MEIVVLNIAKVVYINDVPNYHIGSPSVYVIISGYELAWYIKGFLPQQQNVLATG